MYIFFCGLVILAIRRVVIGFQRRDLTNTFIIIFYYLTHRHRDVFFFL